MTRLRLNWSAIARYPFAVATYLPGMILCAIISGCTPTQIRLPSIFSPGASAESRKLQEIFESYFEAYLDLYPTFATEIGDHRYDDQLEIAISEEHIAAQRRLFQHTLSRLAVIKQAEIDTR